MDLENSDHDTGFDHGNLQEPPLLRRRRIPRPFDDVACSVEDLNDTINAPSLPAQSRIKRVLLTLRDNLQTAFNSVGICRLYPRRPSFEPNAYIPSSLLARSCPTVIQASDPLPMTAPPPYPFPNMTVYRLMSWMNSGSHRKSENEVQRLVKDILQAHDFDINHLEGFSVRRSLRELDDDEGAEKVNFPDDWIKTDVSIDIPTKSKEEGPKTYTIPGFHYRPLVEVIRAAFADVQAGAFHLLPFKRLWKDPLDGTQERLLDELYTSDAWLEAQDNLQKLPRVPGCSLERVVAGLMFFSDATHLANFGTAKAWPLYLYFGNLTKYTRSLPQSGACHLVGFLPSLPDSIKDVLSGLSRISKTGMMSLHTHCRRELFQACWGIMLDEDFLDAYRHGIILKCADGVLRRVFPRIFTYSADYPEKVLIATMKDMGTCACPRCLTPKSLFGSLGMKSCLDNLRVYAIATVIRAREYIYNEGNTVDGSKVERTLGDGSWVPTINRFVEKLGPLGLNPFRMLVVDFMHECELGTWKALFTHLLRLLYALPGGSQLVAKLDTRFRQVPTFGDGVIRKFANNTSEMKRLAARDFEDILQCAIPVFEGLFPPDHDIVVQSLLYRFAQWHALAKLRIHSQSTMTFLEETFKKLSQKLRRFQRDTCAAFNTVELPKEKAARQRRSKERSETNTISPESSGPKVKMFNLNTYKFHAMADYARTIRLFGTTDSFTTQMGELAHRALKAFYPLTSKLDTPTQLAKHEWRRRILRRVAEAGGIASSDIQSPADVRPSASAGIHHHIATNQSSPVDLFAFLRENDGDPAVKNFIPRFKDHVLYRLRKLDITYCDHTFTDEEHNSVIIPNNTIYTVQTMQVHYTTYDLRREHDTINPRTHSDVMVISGETTPSHPYWYARVLGIYHLETWIHDNGPPVKRHLEVLWVRWLAPLENNNSGTRHARLPKVSFVEESDSDAFGFLDPGQVIRGAHLIPAFASGRGISSLRYGKSLARPGGDLDDWEEHYVGIFVDRDMYMRYTHFGVGHPVSLRRIIRDCESLALANAMDVVDEEVDDDEEDRGGDDEQYEDDEFSDEELEDDDEGDGEDDDEGSDDAEDEFNDLSF
ncbi:hypothetical protein CY34DRAFT_14574 [Suillus luteus UH-Slu-Lm8-n1]|uniref:Uncharacterized protein n=1 Tax=Suillus luteus UH-Slu-Lm8-n1 TaxID=930992 RepID=A0A0D0AM21_9AGAM|nr:hypothetical protein CY34DRAFT_14574 [Suillus luteus UH-Slu-Lm8-n1]